MLSTISVEEINTAIAWSPTQALKQLTYLQQICHNYRQFIDADDAQAVNDCVKKIKACGFTTPYNLKYHIKQLLNRLSAGFSLNFTKLTTDKNKITQFMKLIYFSRFEQLNFFLTALETHHSRLLSIAPEMITILEQLVRPESQSSSPSRQQLKSLNIETIIDPLKHTQAIASMEIFLIEQRFLEIKKIAYKILAANLYYFFLIPFIQHYFIECRQTKVNSIDEQQEIAFMCCLLAEEYQILEPEPLQQLSALQQILEDKNILAKSCDISTPGQKALAALRHKTLLKLPTLRNYYIKQKQMLEVINNRLSDYTQKPMTAIETWLNYYFNTSPIYLTYHVKRINITPNKCLTSIEIKSLQSATTRKEIKFDTAIAILYIIINGTNNGDQISVREMETHCHFVASTCLNIHNESNCFFYFLSQGCSNYHAKLTLVTNYLKNSLQAHPLSTALFLIDEEKIAEDKTFIDISRDKLIIEKADGTTVAEQSIDIEKIKHGSEKLLDACKKNHRIFIKKHILNPFFCTFAISRLNEDGILGAFQNLISYMQHALLELSHAIYQGTISPVTLKEENNANLLIIEQQYTIVAIQNALTDQTITLPFPQPIIKMAFTLLSADLLFDKAKISITFPGAQIIPILASSVTHSHINLHLPSFFYNCVESHFVSPGKTSKSRSAPCSPILLQSRTKYKLADSLSSSVAKKLDFSLPD